MENATCGFKLSSSAIHINIFILENYIKGRLDNYQLLTLYLSRFWASQ